MKAHIVPRFHLGRFATPPGRDGFIYVIDKGGRNDRIRVKDAATAEDFYIVEDDGGNPTVVLEDMLQKIESFCARRIERLVSTGQKPSDNDRLTLAYYVVLTHMRTPRMRDHLRWLSDTGTLAHFRSTLEADPPWQRMRAAVFAEMSNEEAEEFRRRTLREIDIGNLEVEFPERYYVVSAIQFLTDQAYIAADMSWTVMRAPSGSEYVIGDHAVSMYDPTIGLRDPRGNGLATSPLAETVLPLDPTVAVKLTFGEEKPWTDAEVEAAVVDEINARTYAGAEREIYGSSQALVVAVRERVRRSPQLMARFKPRLGALLMENDYPLVGGGHRRDVVVHKPPGRVR
jgi:hypothetical protein